jgi:MoxR-like ATPase
MKNNNWNSSVQARDAAATTLPALTPATNDAAFDGVRYRPAMRPKPKLTVVPAAKPASPDAGPNPAVQAVHDAVQETSAWVRPLQQEMGRVIVGQKHLIDRLLIALVTNGHVLLEGVPGLAKTLSLKTLAGGVSLKFQRLQFTPDMLPADIVGTMIYNPQDGGFRTKHGPIFSNLILADEINRAPAKVQSALLEAMQEKQVTIGDQSFKLEEPFLVLATQNPIEQEGTYPLPEAQVDRFMLKLKIVYPSREEERQILDLMARTTVTASASQVVSPRQILEARQVLNDIYMDDKVKDYIVDLVC